MRKENECISSQTFPFPNTFQQMAVFAEKSHQNNRNAWKTISALFMRMMIIDDDDFYEVSDDDDDERMRISRNQHSWDDFTLGQVHVGP